MAEVSLAAAAPSTFFREKVHQHLQQVVNAICAEHDAILEEVQKSPSVPPCDGPSNQSYNSHQSDDSKDRYELRRKRLLRLKVAAQEGNSAQNGGNVSGAPFSSSSLSSRLSNGKHGNKVEHLGSEPPLQGSKVSSEAVPSYASEPASPRHPHRVLCPYDSFDTSSAASSRVPSRASSPARGGRPAKVDSGDIIASFRNAIIQRSERATERPLAAQIAPDSHSPSGSFFGTCGVAMPPGFSQAEPSPPNSSMHRIGSFGNSVVSSFRRRRGSDAMRASSSSRTGNGDWMSDSPSLGMQVVRSRRGGDAEDAPMGRLKSRLHTLGSIKSQVPFGHEGGHNYQSADPTRNLTDNFEFEVLPGWQDAQPPVKAASAGAAKMNRLTVGPMPDLSDVEDESRWSQLAAWCLREGISPASRKRMMWDILTAFFVLWDLVTIPTQFLELPHSTFDTLMNWLVAIFWTSDIFATLATGVVLPDGTVVLALPQIARCYGRSWMLPDVALSLSAWGDIFVGASHGVRFLPFFRVVRMLRLARLARLQVVLNSLMDTNSVMLNLVISFVKSICGIILLVHIIACIWIGIGRLDEVSWVFREELFDAGSSMQYSIAFHWSLTQFTGAYADPWSKKTRLERLFATFSLLFGFLMASCFVSNITSLMTQISIVANHQSHQLKVLSRYLQAHNISKRLSERLQRNVQHALRIQAGGTPEHEIKVLKLVTEPLMKELHFELYAPVLRVHPLFRLLSDEVPASLRTICHTAIAEIVVFEADVIFCPGEVSSNPCMLFVLSGTLQYIQTDEDSDVLDLDRTMPGSEIAHGEWLCEHFLWTKWIYQGMLLAKTESRLLALTARRFQEILSNTKSKLPQYAAQFVAAVNRDIESMSDLGSSVDSEDIVCKLSAGAPRRPSFLTAKRAVTAASAAASAESSTSVVPT